VIAFNARFGPVPLRLAYLGELRGIGPVLAGNVGTGWAFALCARDFGDRLQCLLRTGPAPLAYLGWAPRDRSCARRKARGRMGFRSAPTGHRIPARGETPGMADNRSVLKERRKHSGTLTCFAVAEGWGWRLGLVGGGASAGSVLRSQGTWGQAGLSRWRARGNRVRTFLCSLWTGPAPPGVFGWAPRDRSCPRRKARGRIELSECPNGAPNTSPG
jgi:hypothetical protein